MPLLRTAKSKVPSPPPSLATLPTELLAEVLQHLDWDDALQMRQVCQRFTYASHERSMWLNILRHCTRLRN
ncbi:hypothetical protein CPB83DRAFT_905811 [Crepidotus variabilis]|uniref:F-box domain-containing protein n=1 Tax=Crepidotus variabilis TaxID=179855 RepID=A0A9P6EIH8_9AGAR|nr:hypothetical protein CPB83DRAFT_905811 [Crepidotus variabilis]